MREGDRGYVNPLAHDSCAGVGERRCVARCNAAVASAALSSPRVPDRDAMNAIVLVLRTGMQRNALNVTGVYSSSSAHRRFQEWEQPGVFHEIWREAGGVRQRSWASTGTGWRRTER
jgi:transposase